MGSEVAWIGSETENSWIGSGGGSEVPFLEQVGSEVALIGSETENSWIGSGDGSESGSALFP